MYYCTKNLIFYARSEYNKYNNIFKKNNTFITMVSTRIVVKEHL